MSDFYTELVRLKKVVTDAQAIVESHLEYCIHPEELLEKDWLEDDKYTCGICRKEINISIDRPTEWLLAGCSVMFRKEGNRDEWEVLRGAWTGTLKDGMLTINATKRVIPAIVFSKEENEIINSFSGDQHIIVYELGRKYE